MSPQLELFRAPAPGDVPRLDVPVDAPARLGLPGRVRTALGPMEVAGEEVDAACERHPGARAALDGSWVALTPPGPMVGLSERVYRAHARELLERVAAGGDLRPATCAEVLVRLLALATTAPPNGLYAAVTARMFVMVFPGAEEVAEGLDREPWPGAGDELVAELRHRWRDEGRGRG